MLTETYFEQAIEHYLTTSGGYEKGNPQDYDRDRALFPKDIINFIQHTQPKFWERLSASNKGKAETILLDTLEKELQARRCKMAISERSRSERTSISFQRTLSGSFCG